jgi:starch phosphorylase
VREAWGGVRILSVADDHEPGCEVGDKVTVTAVVDLGQLTTVDARVEMYYGRLDPYGNIADGRVMRMHPTKDERAQAKEFQATMQWKAAGQRGYTIRVTPEHEHLVEPLDMGLVTWAG